MITSDREQQIKLQFLDEANDYLDSIESGLLGLGAGVVSGKELDALLRAAHSIKGGAAMMGYTTLAKLGHPLEDFFKILQYGKNIKPDSQVEALLLSTVDGLRQIVILNRQGKDADEAWLVDRVYPVFDRLREKLGKFNHEDEANMLASESGEDILTFLFESEVERCLEQLEEILSSGNLTDLHEQLLVSTEELGGLAEMLELPAMASLCQSVLAHLAAQPHQINEISALALAGWRRTQAMVLIGQTNNLPIEIELPGSGIVSIGDDVDELSKWTSIDIEETSPDVNLMDLGDFDLNLPSTTYNLDGVEEISEYAIAPELHAAANQFKTLADSFTSFEPDRPQPFSTITASGDLEDIDSSRQVEYDSFDTKEQYLYEIDNTVEASHNAETIIEIDGFGRLDLSDGLEEINAFDRLDLSDGLDQKIDAFDRLDLSGDLSLETEASDLFLALGDLSIEDPGTPSSVFRINPSTPFKSSPKSKGKDDILEREISELFTALDAAPEVLNEHHHHNSAYLTPDNGNNTTQIADQTIRVATQQLEKISNLFGELTIDRNGLNLQLRGIRQLVANLLGKVQQLEQSNFRLRAAYDLADKKTAQPQTFETWNPVASITSEITKELDLLEFDRYTEIHFLSQEVMDTIVQIEEIATDLDLQLNDTERTTRDLNRTAGQLQTGLTQVRMRPISELFDRFPRAIRSLSLEHAKPIDLKLKGGNTLIERTILEALNDPLMHLLRNAFDHGIEPTSVRLANGKPAQGTIEISATYRGNQTVIIIKDDGGGINLDKIRAKVKKMGVDDREIVGFTDNELINLIFEPGFSTTDKVTDLSGRGVGMDVVRTNIRSQRGDISVETKLGKGTTFTISVPFTLSVVRVLLVEINGLRLAIPSNIVEEIILLDQSSIVSTAGQKLLRWENFTVRLIQPKEYLRLPYIPAEIASNEQPTIGCSTVLMVDRGEELVAIEIDKFWGEQEVTIRKPLGNIQMPPGFTGCTILGDGRVVPLVDAIEFIRWIDGGSAVANLTNPIIKSGGLLNGGSIDNPTSPKPIPAPIGKYRILVVDDSINVRRFVALTLEKAGYQVEQAKDGQEAIEKLQSGLIVQAVVCDIEMPRMDGYGFLATVSSQPQFKSIPVLMLTSRSGDKHRKIAMNLGATGYFSKPFKEQELLATLSQLLKT